MTIYQSRQKLFMVAFNQLADTYSMRPVGHDRLITVDDLTGPKGVVHSRIEVSLKRVGRPEPGFVHPPKHHAGRDDGIQSALGMLYQVVVTSKSQLIRRSLIVVLPRQLYEPAAEVFLARHRIRLAIGLMSTMSVLFDGLHRSGGLMKRRRQAVRQPPVIFC